MLELKLLFINLAPWLPSWSLGSGEPSFNQGVAEDLWSGSCEGQSKLLDTSELSVAVLPMLSAKAVLGVKAPNSQSLTRLRTLQKLGLGDFDLARTLRLTLMPLFRCWAFLLAKAAVLGLLARRWTLGLLVALGESVGTVKFNDIVPVRWGVLLQRRRVMMIDIPLSRSTHTHSKLACNSSAMGGCEEALGLLESTFLVVGSPGRILRKCCWLFSVDVTAGGAIGGFGPPFWFTEEVGTPMLPPLTTEVVTTTLLLAALATVAWSCSVGCCSSRMVFI